MNKHPPVLYFLSNKQEMKALCMDACTAIG